MVRVWQDLPARLTDCIRVLEYIIDLPNPGFDGEIFYVQENHSIYYWIGTGWAILSAGTGPVGGTIYSGVGPPIGLIGNSGDFYIDTLVYYLYGPKVGSNWGVGIPLRGPQGVPGSVWYNGTGVPSNSLGVDGDYYYRYTTGDIYFKVGGSW